MRVLFTVSDWPGHYYPLVPLGWALQAAGHEVRVVCAPSEAARIARTGLTPVPTVQPGIDMTFQARLRNYWDAQKGAWPYQKLPLHPVTGEELTSLEEFDFPAYRVANKVRIAKATSEAFDAAVDFARAWQPDLVVHDRMSIEGLLVAQVLGVPSVLHLWGPHGTGEPQPEMRIIPGDPTGSFPRHGAPEMSTDLIEHVIDMTPSSLDVPCHANRMRMRPVPYNGPFPAPVLPEPTEGRPRVAIVWGSSLTGMYGGHAWMLLELAQTFADMDAEMMLLASESDVKALGTPPEGVRVLSNTPLRLVLPTCAALVHHGGAGSLMTGLATGVPQLGIAFAPEQILNVGRLAAAGAALEVVASSPTRLPEAREALLRLLSEPSFTERARALKAEAEALPTPAEVVIELERLAAHARVPVAG